MDISSIGAASIGMSIAKTMQSVNLSVMKKAMDSTESSAEMLIQNLEQANPAPPSGHLLDTYL